MSGRGSYLKEHGGVPLDHPRRCHAHNRSNGQPCRRYAAKGATVCTMHGGAAPQVRRKALFRRYFELDQAAQCEAALNVLLPPELRRLVGGGGRGRRKAAKSVPAQPTLPPLTGIATGPCRGQPAIIDVPDESPSGPPTREAPVRPASEPVDAMRRLHRSDEPGARCR